MSNSNNEKSISSKVENQDKVLIIDSDMDDDMQIAAIEIISKDYYHISNLGNHEIAQKLKETFESKYYPTWNGIVGKNFDCKINAQKNHYLCFQIGSRTVILYKFR